MLTNLLLILLVPLAAFTVQIFVGRKLPRGGDWLSTSALGFALLLALVCFVKTIPGLDPNFRLHFSDTWIGIGGFHLKMGILFDNLTAIMLMVVTIVSFLVHLFSIGYMHNDVRYTRYFAYLGLFTFSMLGIVLCDNLLALYIFWELVGLSSYLLIGHWFEKKSAQEAAKKAFITTRIGDVGMFIGIMIVYSKIGSFQYDDVFRAVANGVLSGSLLTAAGIALFFGAVGKSAQFPLHVWLPDAMEGPTPVSALIHAATMVAAGVYMVGRLFLVFSPDAMLFIAYIGLITAIIAASIAIVQTDIKKALAYSTISQLGFMICALGVGGYTAGLFHLMTHAFFKALLFLGSGSVIHAVHSQEMPEMGGLRKKMPITFWTFLIATLAISGVPGLSGFFSKDAILAAALEFGWAQPAHMIIFILLLATAGVTAFYMFRVVFMTFAGAPRDKHRFDHAHESPRVMAIPLIVLAVLSVGSAWGGWFQKVIVKPNLAVYRTAGTIPGGTTHQEFAVQEAGMAGHAAGEREALPAVGHEAAGGTHGEAVEGGHEGGHEAAHKAHMIAMVASILVAGCGILLSWAFYSRKRFSADAVRQRLSGLHTLLTRKYYLDEIYLAGVVRPVMALSRAFKWFDLTVIDGIVNGSATLTKLLSWVVGFFDNKVIDGMVNGVAALVAAWGRQFRRIQTGKLQNYLLGFVAVALVIVVVRLIRGF
jgi:NADH-quinone oxidoreductase subunit L